jgi:hypothetical protein
LNREWHKDALCANEASDFWFYEMPVGGQLTPDIKNQIKIAVKICGDCPVKSQCLDQGLERENLIIGSIWGGLVFRERQYLAKRRKASTLN